MTNAFLRKLHRRSFPVNEICNVGVAWIEWSVIKIDDDVAATGRPRLAVRDENLGLSLTLSASQLILIRLREMLPSKRAFGTRRVRIRRFLFPQVSDLGVNKILRRTLPPSRFLRKGVSPPRRLMRLIFLSICSNASDCSCIRVYTHIHFTTRFRDVFVERFRYHKGGKSPHRGVELNWWSITFCVSPIDQRFLSKKE